MPIRVKIPKLKLPEEALDLARDDLARDAVKVIRRDLVPVDRGDLRDSIRFNFARQRIETLVSYAPFVEYGTVDTPAQPFFRVVGDKMKHWQINLNRRRSIEREGLGG